MQVRRALGGARGNDDGGTGHPDGVATARRAGSGGASGGRVHAGPGGHLRRGRRGGGPVRRRSAGRLRRGRQRGAGPRDRRRARPGARPARRRRQRGRHRHGRRPGLAHLPPGRAGLRLPGGHRVGTDPGVGPRRGGERGLLAARPVLLRRAGAARGVHLHRDPGRHHAVRVGVPARPARGRPLPHRRGVLGLRPVEARQQPARAERRGAPSDRRRRPVRAVRGGPVRLQRTRAAVVDARPVDGLRGRRRQRPRHRLLGRCVRLLRTAPAHRRLRRDRDRGRPAVGEEPQGRHGRPVLPGHQPALRGVHAAPIPVRDHSAVGHRRHGARDAGAGRHLQRRLRAVVGRRGRREGEALRAGLGAGPGGRR